MLAIPAVPEELCWSTDEWLGEPACETVAETYGHQDVALNLEGAGGEDAHVEDEKGEFGG